MYNTDTMAIPAVLMPLVQPLDAWVNHQERQFGSAM